MGGGGGGGDGGLSGKVKTITATAAVVFFIKYVSPAFSL